MVELAQKTLDKHNIEVYKNISGSRDMGVYAIWMDNALPDKIRRVNLGLEGFEMLDKAVIVEVGSGTGTLAEHFAEAYRGARVIGVDISQELREIAANRPHYRTPLG